MLKKENDEEIESYTENNKIVSIVNTIIFWIYVLSSLIVFINILNNRKCIGSICSGNPWSFLFLSVVVGIIYDKVILPSSNKKNSLLPGPVIFCVVWLFFQIIYWKFYRKG